ncbi:hypothetical protein E2562_016401 [Oryza meyeriana var. granulata]|uniref:Uncharacterized protein n=1 Tax=Oryza meyeriana var. granulata TaxID=110450 RepID=A0A6G1EX69_9ORYZ|nr:hypothetical protein E2562_016401 [Oryza meyeriana var. granulata]
MQPVVGRAAGVAARAAVRAAERSFRRRVLVAVTGGITVADLLLATTIRSAGGQQEHGGDLSSWSP